MKLSMTISMLALVAIPNASGSLMRVDFEGEVVSMLSFPDDKLPFNIGSSVVGDLSFESTRIWSIVDAHLEVNGESFPIDLSLSFVSEFDSKTESPDHVGILLGAANFTRTDGSFSYGYDSSDPGRVSDPLYPDYPQGYGVWMDFQGPSTWFDNGESIARILKSDASFTLSEGWVEYRYNERFGAYADFRLTRLAVVPEPSILGFCGVLIPLAMRRGGRKLRLHGHADCLSSWTNGDARS